MNEERTIILEMLQNGKISIEEANQLLDALPPEEAEQKHEETGKATARPGETPTHIRIEVTGGGNQAVNVRLPVSLVRTGLKFSKAFGKKAGRKNSSEQAAAMDALQDLDIDEIMNTFYTLGESLPYTVVDVDGENGEHVKIILDK